MRTSASRCSGIGKNQNFFARRALERHARGVVIERAPLEDELGDVLDKAMRHAGLTEQELATRARVDVNRLHDAIDYRGTFDPDELVRLADVLGLNSTGLAAVGSGRYPLPEATGLPFCLYPLRMAYGIGVANAYVTADCSSDGGLLFDCGTDAEALRRVWPSRIRRLEAIFLTHYDTEHVGGLAELRARYPGVPVFGPGGDDAPGAIVALKDGAALEVGGFTVRVLHTPGHAESHHCYLVSATRARGGQSLLVTGDLLFAGSVGGCYFCRDRLIASLNRICREVPVETVVAPGHGPMTTIKNERAYNPFVL